MKIAFDGRTIRSVRTGVGAYARRTIQGLLRINSSDEFHLFIEQETGIPPAPNLLTIPVRTLYRGPGANRLWENSTLTRYLKKQKIDLLFSPAFVLPLVLKDRKRKESAAKKHEDGTSSGLLRTIVAIHDLVSIIHPETMTGKMRRWNSYFIRHAVRHAHRLIVPSESTRRDILRIFRDSADDSRISLLPLAVDEDFTSEGDLHLQERVRRTYDLPRQFILHVGTIEPRKNVTTLADAYARLPADLRNEWPLVLCGPTGWLAEGIVRHLEHLQLGDQLRMHGFVRQEHLPAIYRMAGVFVYPSLYEGFGYPPLEAMACGTPVICSNASSLPEVVGDAALLFSPEDTTALQHHLLALLTTPSLRETLRRKGLGRIDMFHWQRYAESLQRIFRECCL